MCSQSAIKQYIAGFWALMGEENDHLCVRVMPLGTFIFQIYESVFSVNWD